MNIDERLEALTQTVEIIAGMQRAQSERQEALAQTVEIIAGMQRANEERFAQHEERAAQMMDAITRLAHIAEIHERRLDDLEG